MLSSIEKDFKKPQFILGAVLLVIVGYLLYKFFMGPSVLPSASASESFSDKPNTASSVPVITADQKKSEEIRSQYNSVKSMNPSDLLPSGSGTGSFNLIGASPGLDEIRDRPSRQTVTERIGASREVNKNPFILGGIQFSQPDVVSGVPLNSYQSDIGPAKTYSNLFK